MKRILTMLIAILAITTSLNAQIYHGNKHIKKHKKHHSHFGKKRRVPLSASRK